MPVSIVESLDQEGRGIVRLAGKTVFVEGALPGETVEFASFKRKPTYELATTTRVIAASPYRTAPRCAHFGVCGGCSFQHLEAGVQVAVKQRVLEDALWHVGRIRAECVYPPIHGPAWGYRFRARLTVRRVLKKGGVLVGFHERRSSYVADMRDCRVLPERVAALLPRLRDLVGALSIPDRLPQIEVAVAEGTLALVLRILEAPSEADERRLRDFAADHDLRLYLQTGGPETARLFHPADAPPLAYQLPEFGVALGFLPTDFTQVNHAMNRVLVRRALRLLDPRPGERIGDMFCGIGNFSLPIARSGAAVVGVEGHPGLTRRAAANAEANGLAARASFVEADLFEIDAARLAGLGAFDKLIIDPPREGAVALVRALADAAPRRVVYVSCSPATLARDAAILVREKGFRLAGAGIANMFPHTAHVESIALFER